MPLPSYINRSEAREKLRRRVRAAIRHVCWAYLILILAFCGYVRVCGDWTWFGTVVLFGPLWIALTPAAILAPLALLIRRRSLWVVAAAICIALFPVMGFCFPWRMLFHHAGGGQHLRVFTCNINRSSLNESALAAFVDQTHPDVVVLQEWTAVDRRPTFVDSKWHYQDFGELCVASRYPIHKAEDLTDPHWIGWGGAICRYDIAAPGGTVHLFNIHLASPHNQFQDIIDGKPTAEHLMDVHLEVRREQSQIARRLAERFGGEAILAGDFNSIAQGSIFRHAWKNFSDAFVVAGFGVGHTYFGEGAAVRIDHILAGGSWQVNSCQIGPNVGSPHRPLVADLEKVGG